MNGKNILWIIISAILLTSFILIVSCGGEEENGGVDESELPAAAKTVYLTAYHPSYGAELWKSDGTKAGTVLVKDINTTPNPYTSLAGIGGEVPMGDTIGSNPSNMTPINGIHFFTADDGTTGYELWKSDGTEAGTMLVKDIYPGTDIDGFPNNSFPSNLVNLNGTLYFQANDGITGTELWKSDGTGPNTTLVKDIYIGASWQGSYPSYLTVMNGTLYFRANDGITGTELWKSDGTGPNTTLVKDIFPGINSSYPSNLTEMNGVLCFQANDGSNGTELWKSDGTGVGTVLLKDINPGDSYGPSPNPLSSYPGLFTEINSTLFFVARDYTHGYELWKSDGTTEGTALVIDILTGETQNGPLSSNPSYFENAGDTLLFAATDETHGNELWRSDGTGSGTSMVKDINEGVGSSFAFGRDDL